MTEKLVLSVLVENTSGVLQRVASLFSRRGYNINSLTVSATEDPAFSRMTISTTAEPEMFRQIERQLLKLEIVKKVAALTDENSVASEMLLVKVPAKGVDVKNAILVFNMKYGARVLDVSTESMTLEFTGISPLIDEFISQIDRDYGIIEMARTGLTALERGAESFSNDV